MDSHETSSAKASDWIDAVELGGRREEIPTDVLGQALQRLREARGTRLEAEVVSGWVGLPRSTLLTLLARTHGNDDAMPTALAGQARGGTAATSPTRTSSLPDPRRLGPYDLIAELGRGGMGIVYRARHAELGTECAVKVLASGDLASDQAVARFRREASAVARMGRHPNIVAVHDLAEQEGRLYYAMELVDGEPLDTLTRSRFFSAHETASLVERVARAVHFAHEHGVIHRDLKPQNVLVQRDGEPRVADFGLAKELGREGSLSMTGDVMGTLGYMAPEQARGDVNATDARTDVYALGGILYQMLSGVPPHPGGTAAVVLPRILSGEIVAPRRLHAEVPRDLETICMKALSLAPSRRYPTAEAFADDLARWRRGEPIHARPAGPVERLILAIRRRPLPYVATAISVAALVAGVLIAQARARGEAERGARSRRDAAARILSSLPADRRAAIEALVRADELLREGERILAPYGGDGFSDRYEANLRLGTLAIEGGDFTLAEIAFSACRSVDSARARADRLSKRVAESREAESRRRAARIAAALEDLGQGLAREGRSPGAETLEDYVFEVSGFRDSQTVELLARALSPIVEKAQGEGRSARWTDPERDTVRFAVRTLGRLGMASVISPLGELMGVLWDHELVVECGLALGNTRLAAAAGPLLEARTRLGVNSAAWAAISPAVDRLPELADSEPTTWEGHYARGDYRMARGDIQGALEDLSAAVELAPREPRCWVHLGNARMESGDAPGAVEAYGKAIDLDSSTLAAWLNRAQAKRTLGDLEGTVADATEAVHIDEGEPLAWMVRGAANFELGRFRESIADLDRAIEIDPTLARAYMVRAMARRDDPRAAMKDFDWALRLSPRDPDILVGRGHLKRRLGDLQGALSDASEAMAIDPGHGAAWGLRGQVRHLQGDLPGALADLTTAMDRGGKTAEVVLLRADLRRRMGSLREALADYDEAVRLDPRSAAARSSRGAMRYGLRDVEGAIQDLTAAIELDGGYSKAWANRGVLHAREGRPKEAISDLTKTLELDPGNTTALRFRGQAKEETGDLAGAVADWERYLELSPGGPDAEQVRERLDSARVRLKERR